MEELRCFCIYITIRRRKERNMDNLRKRKFNTYYWTCVVVAVCMLILSNIEWERILAGLMGSIFIPFYGLDERGQYAFPDNNEEDEG